jgi:hypothetical protein
MVIQKSFGQILLPNDPGAALQAGTKQYVDTAIGTCQALNSSLTAIAGLAPSTGQTAVWNGTTWVAGLPLGDNWSDLVETLADGSTISPNCNSGAIRVGSCTSLSQDTTLNAPANGAVGATYRAQITAFSTTRNITLSGWVGTTDNSTTAIVVPAGKTVSVLGEYCAAGWLYGGYTLQA